MLDRLAASGSSFRHILDLGAGTGVLAFAAGRAFGGRDIASDIGPVSIEVARQNAVVNQVPLGRGPGEVELLVADGLSHRRLKQRAPYDLVIANILAGPLIDMAPAIAEALKPGGTLILAGLLDHQADAVLATYMRQGCRPAGRIDREDRSEQHTSELQSLMRISYA